MTPATKARFVKTLARSVGFDLVGVTLARPLERAAYYRDWLAAGHAGTMAYLKRNVQIRANPAELLPRARSVICVAINYRRADGYARPPRVEGSEGRGPDGLLTGRVAQYARGRDYHVVFHRLLTELVERLRERLQEPFESRAFVDTGPLLERELAAAAGLGWIGKNTCLLNEKLGSYLLLGELITTLDLAPDEPVAERCAACTRCIKACPTNAIIGPRALDASRCIAYLTIEDRSEIPGDLQRAMGDWVFGCDACQQVCPYNARGPVGKHPELAGELFCARPDLIRLLALRSGDYRRLTVGTAVRRATRNMWRRNAAIALGNAGGQDARVTQALEAACEDGDAGVRQAARLSLGRMADPSE